MIYANHLIVSYRKLKREKKKKKKEKEKKEECCKEYGLPVGNSLKMSLAAFVLLIWRFSKTFSGDFHKPWEAVYVTQNYFLFLAKKTFLSNIFNRDFILLYKIHIAYNIHYGIVSIIKYFFNFIFHFISAVLVFLLTIENKAH